MGCQRDIAEKILDKKADYVLALKGNQGSLREDVEVFAAEQKANGFKDTKVSRHETVALELLGVERGKDVAEVIVRGRSIAKRQEPAQKADLLLAEPRDIAERLGAAEHREQAQQQHLGEWIKNFSALPRVRKIPETLKKNNSFARRPKLHRSFLHRPLRKPNQRITTDSAIQPFVTKFFTRLPC